MARPAEHQVGAASGIHAAAHESVATKVTTGADVRERRVRVELDKRPTRVAVWLGVRLVIGLVAVLVGGGSPGLLGSLVAVGGSAVCVYVVILAAHVITARVEVMPDELHVASVLWRRRYRLARGAVTRLHVPQRRGFFRTQLGGFGIELGEGTTDSGEPVDVVRLAPGSTLILVPTVGRRVALKVADENALVRALEWAAGQSRSR